MIKEVLVVFKTHLDIGFTDFAETVSNRYLEEFIPGAVRLGYTLKDSDPFIWSVGSWLIHEGLKRDDGTLEQAIRDGVISWHGLPFTSYTECMNETLFEYALSLSDTLDARFGTKTIAAKMTDVPGHTRAMIKHLCRHGIEFLHIGINPAANVPDVPPLFRWKNGEDEITVMYDLDYGKQAEFDDFAVVFGFTGDNHGPQDPEVIRAQYQQLRERYPDADVHAATLNDVAIRLRSVRDTLPVIESEIGDSWIHGIGTDPKKLSLYRSLLRHIEKEGIKTDIADSLLLVPEHTFGGDIKKFFNNQQDYTREDMEALADNRHRKRIEASWAEQRAYIDRAQEALGTHITYDTSLPDLSSYRKTAVPELPFVLSWQLFDCSDLTRFETKYMNPQMRGVYWATLDYIKMNLPRYTGECTDAVPVDAWEKGGETVVRLQVESEMAKREGVPAFYAMLRRTDAALSIKLIWQGQKPTRLPNAYWIKFTGLGEEAWEIEKLGEWIDASDVIASPLIAGFDRGVRNGGYMIESYDAGLAAPFGRRLYDFERHPQGQDMYINLYNNVWNTNHPLWYSDDAVFRFAVKKR